jgi:hypothetical protein
MIIQNKNQKQIVEDIQEETNRNKIFVVLLGILILGMAFFGKVINDSANNAFDKVETHFTLSNDYLSSVFDSYSCLTVDGVVKVAHKIKTKEQVLEEMQEKLPILKEKLEYYFKNTTCTDKQLLLNLQNRTERTDKYLKLIVKNFQSDNGVDFALDTLDSGELYKNTDDILDVINSLLNYHLDAAKRDNDTCQKSLKSFRKICIVSSSIGLTIITAVILKFFSEKNEIQKRNSNNISGKSVGRRKSSPRSKKSVQNKK